MILFSVFSFLFKLNASSSYFCYISLSVGAELVNQNKYVSVSIKKVENEGNWKEKS